jgi:hypothetical protein
MEPASRQAALAPWEGLRNTLAGSFSARPEGLIAPNFVLLDREGEEFGRLLVHEQAGAKLDAGPLRVRIERLARSRYRMITGETETLVAEPAGSSVALEITCADRIYEARVSLLRNSALARAPGGAETARATGGFVGRGYDVLFDAGDERSLPVAVFLLYHAVALRRRVFQAGSGPGSRSP